MIGRPWLPFDFPLALLRRRFRLALIYRSSGPRRSRQRATVGFMRSNMTAIALLPRWTGAAFSGFSAATVVTRQSCFALPSTASRARLLASDRR